MPTLISRTWRSSSEGVFLFDDLYELTGVGLQHTSVSGRILEAHSHQCARGALSIVRLDKLRNRRRLNEWNVARQNHYRAIFAAQNGLGGDYRIASASLLTLMSKRDAVILRRELCLDGGGNFFGLMADHDVNTARFECESCATDVRDQRSAIEFVQDLRAIRFHARAQARSHNDDVEWLTVTRT
jgi:hypothetical protein